ncbi:hypothetical protein [Paenibacillus sp. PAMC 26794]|uniref:hypothetical protein n=1 Tax=Paenibacillus sp. PAMC 26794 TaxID=1257080 RepID=UPI00036FC3CC|nr:hypothetical protein [Paenibacillus sp. PAMC 26794]
MDVINDSIEKSFTDVSMAMIEALGIYLVLPIIVAAVLVRFVFRLRGPAFKLVYGIIAFGCLYLFVYKGIPHFQIAYESRLSK